MRALILAAALAVPLAVPMAAGPGGAPAHAQSLAAAPGFRIGSWEAASVGSGIGLPVICGAAMHQGGNESLGLMVDIMGRMWLLASSPRWAIPPGRPIGTLLSFDDGPRESTLARASDPRELRFDIAADGPFEQRLRRAGRLSIYAAGQVTQYRLEQVGDVIDQLRRCTAEGTRATAEPRPADARGRDPTAPRSLARAAAILPIPTAGWPDIQRDAVPRPAPVAGTASRLSLPALYRTLSQSVWLVAFERGSATTWTGIGSAVAVSHDTLLTNCHVVMGARRIELRRARTVLSATILAGDPRTDRCLLRTTGAVLTPVPGLRDPGSLAVGERAYSIGNPSGLEATFGEGIVSGLRQSGGIQLIQTTAPASPGSSGGGLFDARGNLLGITTFVIRAPGNTDTFRFAIAAAEYWR
jgi:hypothetical protein